MKQVQVSKRRRAGDRLDPLPTDPRDPDIVRAKQLARQPRTSPQRSGNPGLSQPDRGRPTRLGAPGPGS